MMDVSTRFSLRTLEFDSVLEIVGAFLSGPISRLRLNGLAPTTDLEQIRQDLARAGEARRYTAEDSRPALGGLRDPHLIFQKLAVAGLSCESLEIVAMTEMAASAQGLRHAFESYPVLH